MYVTWESVSVSWDLTMRGKDISYGANVFFYRYAEALSQFFSQWFVDSQVARILKMGPIILASILVFMAGIAGMRDREPLAICSERNLAAFRMGASIYTGTFLLGNNWDYRLAFLVLVLPQLLEWTRSSIKKYRTVALASLLGVLASCWHFVLWYSPFFNFFQGSKEWWFVLDEFLNWMLVSGFAYLLLASAPGWLKNGRQRIFEFPRRQIA